MATELDPTTHGTTADTTATGAERTECEGAVIGDLLWVEGIRTVPAEAGPDAEADAEAAAEADADVVNAVVTVARVTRMRCGCDRVSVNRPFSGGGPCPTVDLVSPGCDRVGCGPDRVDVAAARETAQHLVRTITRADYERYQPHGYVGAVDVDDPYAVLWREVCGWWDGLYWQLWAGERGTCLGAVNVR